MNTVNDENFNDVVAENKQLQLVYFWSPKCGPCKMLAPMVREIHEKSLADCEILKYDTTVGSVIAKGLGVTGVPTMVLFKDGKRVDSLSGFTSQRKILEFIRKHN